MEPTKTEEPVSEESPKHFPEHDVEKLNLGAHGDIVNGHHTCPQEKHIPHEVTPESSRTETTGKSQNGDIQADIEQEQCAEELGKDKNRDAQQDIEREQCGQDGDRKQDIEQKHSDDQDKQQTRDAQQGDEQKQCANELNTEAASGPCNEGQNAESSNATESTAEKSPEDTENDGWTYVLGHDKLKLKVLREGGGVDTRPVYGQVVTVRCCGELEDGTKIDECEELKFTVGDGDVIQAFDLCVALMQLGELSQIVTDGKYAYGVQGRKPDVPADAVVTYEIELLKVEEAPDVTSLSIADKIHLGNEKRGRGNFWYNRGDFAASINSYTRALRLLDESNIASEPSDSIQQFTDMRIKCFNNLAAAQLKVEAWDAGIKSCDSVLKLQPDNCKAHFRKGKCLAAKGELEPAITSLREAIKLEPESKIIHQELSRLVNKHRIQTQSTKEMYQRMLGTDKAAHKADKSRTNWWLYGGAVTAALVSAGIAAYRYW